jgi:hypothetical protein
MFNQASRLTPQRDAQFIKSPRVNALELPLPQSDRKVSWNVSRKCELMRIFDASPLGNFPDVKCNHVGNHNALNGLYTSVSERLTQV